MTARKKADKSQSNLEEVCFEEALSKLELIVKELEQGELPLEQSLARYAEGITFSKICLEKLNAAEKAIDLIVREEHGKMTEKALELE